MKKTWQWILLGIGVFVVVFLIALFVINRFTGFGMPMMGLSYRFHPMMRFPMMGGFGFFGGFRIFGILLFLAFIALVVWGIVTLFRRKPAQIQTPAPEMKTCSNCGKPVQVGWVACPYCGNPLT
jgi:hypothetical protein